MTKITFMPHPMLCPDGKTVLSPKKGDSILNIALANGIYLEHACEKVCACTTCHIYVREGSESLNDANDQEEDMLDRAWGLDPDSRLSCQTKYQGEALTVEIPKYTLNHAREGVH